MPQPSTASARRATWLVPFGRAIPALALAGFITFSPDHSSNVGLLAFGIFGVITGLVLAAGAASAAAGLERGLGFVQAAIAVVTGTAALALMHGGLPLLVFLVTAFAASAGAIELFLGVRARPRTHASRDRVFVGALTALLAVGLLLVPPGLEQPLGGLEGVDGVLTASVVVVGSLGAYWAVLGVYLAIAGLSARWDARAAAIPESAVKA